MSSTRIWFSPHPDSLIATGIRLIFLDSFLANLSYLLAFSQLNLFLIIIHNTCIHLFLPRCSNVVAILQFFSSASLSLFVHFPPPCSILSLSLSQYSFSTTTINSGAIFLIEENSQLATRSEIHVTRCIGDQEDDPNAIYLYTTRRPEADERWWYNEGDALRTSRRNAAI